MKTIRFFLTAIILSSLIGCSSSDDDGPSGPQVSSNLYGEWTLVFKNVNGQLQGDLSCEERIDYKFNSDKTYSKTRFSTNDQNNCVEAISFTGTWEIITKQSIKLTPNISSVDAETIEFELINSDETLQIFRNTTTTEIYQRP